MFAVCELVAEACGGVVVEVLSYAEIVDDGFDAGGGED